jgi:hypothetical protein
VKCRADAAQCSTAQYNIALHTAAQHSTVQERDRAEQGECLYYLLRGILHIPFIFVIFTRKILRIRAIMIVHIRVKIAVIVTARVITIVVVTVVWFNTRILGGEVTEFTENICQRGLK